MGYLRHATTMLQWSGVSFCQQETKQVHYLPYSKSVFNWGHAPEFLEELFHNTPTYDLLPEVLTVCSSWKK